jgi:hypothetical protein
MASRTSRSSTARSGGSRSSRSGSSRSRSAPAAGTQAAPAGVVAQQNIPALSEEAKAQAERDRTGKTRPGFVRRDLPAGGSYAGVSYRAGEKVEIPQAFADHLDTIGINPDASTEASRKTRFGGGKEDDQDAQGKAISSQRDDSLKAQVKHRQRPEFQAIASPKKGSAK